MLVVLAESVELHVGNVILDPVEHVNVTVCEDELIAVLFIFPPVPPFAFNVIVFVFALHEQLEPEQLADVPVLVPPLVLYPVEQVPLHALPLTVPFVQFVQLQSLLHTA